MLKKILPISLLIFSLSLHGQEENQNIDLSLSETLGHLIVRQLKQPGFDFNIEYIIQGMRDEQAGKPSPLTEEEYEQAMCALQEKQFLVSSELNLKEAENFLEHNALTEGIQQINSQLQFQILQEGSGEVVEIESTPLIHYKGKLMNGTVFATSETANQPVVLPIKQSIPGFCKGLIGMKEGEKRILYIHPELAYGISGNLPPNSLLIFEVEIVKANSPLANDMTFQDEENPSIE